MARGDAYSNYFMRGVRKPARNPRVRNGTTSDSWCNLTPQQRRVWFAKRLTSDDVPIITDRARLIYARYLRPADDIDREVALRALDRLGLKPADFEREPKSTLDSPSCAMWYEHCDAQSLNALRQHVHSIMNTRGISLDEAWRIVEHEEDAS